jgi:hypothetical protein
VRSAAISRTAMTTMNKYSQGCAATSFSSKTATFHV